MMTAAKIAAALGNARREGRGWRTLCPIHGGHSLVVADGRDGRLLLRCWGGGCDARDILAELRRCGLLGHNTRSGCPLPATARTSERDDAAHRIAMALRIWNTARDAPGTPVERYLAGRGIVIPLPSSLRWRPRCGAWTAPPGRLWSRVSTTSTAR
jgi:hypothetical protein